MAQRAIITPHVVGFLDCPLFAGKVAIDGLFFLSIVQKSLIVVMGDTNF